MSDKDYLKDISEIKNIMNRSTRFLSLSGLSGILAGCYALIGAFITYKILETSNYTFDYSEKTLRSNYDTIANLKSTLIGLALLVAFLSVISAYFLTKQKAKKNNEKIWTPASRQLLSSFAIPMITGGVFIFLLVQKGIYGIAAPAALIFYGLALINASKYTLSQVRFLGLLEILLGLLALVFFGNGLLFWILGFGVLHIIYGGLMYFKMERSK
ncbi:hypothetical protein UMM65_05695 [Aureibaculum sp. 2210JD6-5]|uniref:hypothetical protein n=1 Tax=Aureibaculum sp. 2210JD6-5 TaxID=3103957 RepID=UPI002AAEDB51|nr:hypothetical protein [Aureibaculum sp. 2210JD6-5]MDY7394726.1 hypothetical protein [Aureibaculum sp. 2210JD6-5]